MHMRPVAIAIVLLAFAFPLAAATSNPNELVLKTDWTGTTTPVESWVMIASPGASPDVEVLEAQLQSTVQDDAATTVRLSQLGQAEREVLAAAIADRIALRHEGHLRFWSVFNVEVKNRSVSAEEASYTLQSLSFALKGLSAGEASAATSRPLRQEADWGFAPALRELAVNGENFAALAGEMPASFSGAEADPWSPRQLPPGQAVFQFSITQDAFTAITGQTLKDAGLEPARIDPASIRLASRGLPVPLFRDDNGDAAFEDGEALIFYGRQSESPYSQARAYWLVIGATDSEAAAAQLPPVGEDGADTPVQPWHLATERVEVDEFPAHALGNFLEVGDVRWVWQTVTGDDVTSATFSLPDFDTASDGHPQTVELTLDFFHLPDSAENLPPNSLSIGQRKVAVSLNGHDLGEHAFSGHRDTVKTLAVPLNVLRAEGNELHLRLEAQQDVHSADQLAAGTYFDAATVRYPARPALRQGRLRLEVAAEDHASTQGWMLADVADPAALTAYDITHPEQPHPIEILRQNGSIIIPPQDSAVRLVEVIDRGALAATPPMHSWEPSSLRDPSNEADYLIITHPAFADLIQPLADQKQRMGIAVKTVSILDVYDAFSYGELTPFAIKNFLLHAMREWRVPPTYVLLVGDCTSDFRNDLREDLVNFIPSYRNMAVTDNTDSWASDHWFTTLLGDDELSDVILGRLSVASEEDAREVIRKQVMAGEGLPLGPWRNRVLTVADERERFELVSERFRNEFLPKNRFLSRVYLGHMLWERNFYLDPVEVANQNFKVSTAATQAILDALNRGMGTVAFWGHGSPNIWTDERIWFGMDSPNSDNLLLRNMPQLPLVMNMTCNTGAIDYPKPPYNICISEDMMRVTEGGSRAAYVPSGPGSTDEHEQLARAILPALLSGRVPNQGDALLVGKTRYSLADYPNADYVRMYIYLGDPAMPLPVPRQACSISVQPGAIDLRQQRSTFTARLESIPFDSGNIVFKVAAPPDDLSDPEESKPIAFSPSQRTFSIRLPEIMEPGTWSLKAYAWNSESNQEASGHIDFVVDYPYAEIADLRVIEAEDGGQERIEVQVKNPTALPVERLHVQVSERMGSVFDTLGGETLDLAPGEARTIALPWEAKGGRLHEIRAALLNYTESPVTESTVATSKEIVWSKPDPSLPPRFALSALSLKREFRDVNPVVEAEVRVPIYSVGGDYEGPVEVGWGWGDTVATTGTLHMASGQLAGDFVFSLRTDEALPKPFVVEVDPKGKINQSTEPAKIYSALDLKGLPNLAFARGKGVLTVPGNPYDGQTIIFHVPIRNSGTADAGHFRVSAYDDDPTSGGVEIESTVGPSFAEFPGLGAGAETEAVVRWDPKSNPGANRLYFKIDSLERVVESSERDNTAAYTVHVRTLAKLEPVSLELDRDRLLRRRVRVAAQVRNAGETEARNVILEFYNDREGDPGHKMGQKFIERIAPGQTITETYEWELPENFFEEVQRALEQDLPDESIKIDYSVQIFLRGSLQRVEMAPRSVTRATESSQTP